MYLDLSSQLKSYRRQYSFKILSPVVFLKMRGHFFWNSCATWTPFCQKKLELQTHVKVWVSVLKVQSGVSKFLLTRICRICRSVFWVFSSVHYHLLVEMVTMFRIITDCIWHLAWEYNNMCFWLTTSREEFFHR